ncbi:class I SAM-dependent methyltransferase [Candidatus Contubernalis alkaliaceticus]|uniref:class I SAM-dependent methyltransferase n=1 Tax=Candidatus Contubernalis alkaliaceticus TaxID=338645 RepID=UPI001F4C0DBF|nr:class I SAM-dependent methyltransferase [Candidatus Contubernalis alkalaceticus]UNC93598.1 class I SAM-dependent methyltransferase [Candidatus Contubernalis alkalaceticus]
MSKENKTAEIEEYIYKRILENQEKNLLKKEDSSFHSHHDFSLDIGAVYREMEEGNNTWNIQGTAPSSQKKIIGPVITLFKKVIRKLISWYLEPIMEQQRIYNASVNRSLQELCLQVSGSVNYHHETIHELKAVAADLNNQVSELKLKGEIREELLIKQMKTMEGRLKYIENSFLPSRSKQAGLMGAVVPFDYLELENQFRGKEQDIKERLSVYLPFFQGKSKVLDIGCGRGEMLELLQENDIDALGIDTDEEMVKHCGGKGLKVKKQDAALLLETLEDNTIEGVFMGHVVEHLDLDYMIELFRLIYKKIMPGGVLLLESPNPICLYIFSASFYIDPTHIKPLNPYTLEHLLQSIGFKGLNIMFHSPVPHEQKLELLNLPEEHFKRIDNNMKKLNDLIYGYQDYSIAAVK